MKVTIVYATTDDQFLAELDLEDGSTVQHAIEQSGLLQQHTEISLNENRVGVFNQIVSLDTKLKDKDRVEVYRSLLIDPMEARRLRAICDNK